MLIVTCVSEELQSPQELDDVEHAQEAGVEEVEEVVIGVAHVREAEVLEEQHHHQSAEEHQEQQHVEEIVGIFE